MRNAKGDLLNQYAVQAAKTKVREDIHLDYGTNLLIPFVIQIFDTRVLIQVQDGTSPTRPYQIRKNDEETIALWINYATVTQSTQQRTVVEYEVMLAKAKKVIEALVEEYDLE